MTCLQFVQDLFKTFSQFFTIVHEMLRTCSHFFTIFSHLVQDFSVIVHDFFISAILFHDLLTICSCFIQDLFATCLWLVQNLFINFSQLVHDSFFISFVFVELSLALFLFSSIQPLTNRANSWVSTSTTISTSTLTLI